MQRKKYLIAVCLTFTGLMGLSCVNLNAQKDYNILDYGAKSEENVLNTMAIQNAIDMCASEGGGRVVIPAGTFMSGSVLMRSNVELWLDEGAVLKGSPEKVDYTKRALIFAKNQVNMAINGPGTIDGNGDHKNFYSPNMKKGLGGRPRTIRFENCRGIKFSNFTLQKGATHCINILDSENINVDNIKIIARVVANNDGLDLMDCHNATITNSYFDTGDDAICLKSHNAYGIENITIKNCKIKSESNAIKFGTTSVGAFKNVNISNCEMFDTRLSGLALELVDGGIMDQIHISDIKMKNVDGAIFIKLGQREGFQAGTLKNVTIENVVAEGIGKWNPETDNIYYKNKNSPKIGVSLVGQPGHPIENITLRNVKLEFAGGGTLKDATRIMKDFPEKYPEYNNFGVTPAYGINCRHANNIVFDNVTLSYIDRDDRPAMYVENVNALTINNLDASASSVAPSFIKLQDAQNIQIKGCNPDSPKVPFLSLEGNISKISLSNNDLSKTNQTYVAGPAVNTREVLEN